VGGEGLFVGCVSLCICYFIYLFKLPPGACLISSGLRGTEPILKRTGRVLFTLLF
jgi:hypothetical protein